MVHICCIAAHDTSNGAGVTRDCIVANDFGVFAHPIITAITTQSFTLVERISPLSAELVEHQLNSVLKHFPVSALKIGMIYNSQLIDVVSRFASKLKGVNIIVDPIIKSSGGQPLLTDDGITALKEKLFPIASIIAPNRHELEVLSGETVHSFDDAQNVARSLARLYRCKVLLKGGHFDNTLVNDYLISENNQVAVSHERRHYKYSHGSGCVLSTALACTLALGFDDAQALNHAVNYTLRYFDSVNIAMIQDVS